MLVFQKDVGAGPSRSEPGSPDFDAFFSLLFFRFSFRVTFSVFASIHTRRFISCLHTPALIYDDDDVDDNDDDDDEGRT